MKMVKVKMEMNYKNGQKMVLLKLYDENGKSSY